MPDTDQVRGEIEHMRAQIGGQRGEILQIQAAGASRRLPAEELQQTMLDEVGRAFATTGPVQQGSAGADQT